MGKQNTTLFLVAVASALGGVPFANVTEAQAAILAFVSNCIGFIAGPPTTVLYTFSATFASSTLTLASTLTGIGNAGSGADMSSSINLKVASTLTINYVVSRSGDTDPGLTTVDIEIFNCDGTIYYDGSFDTPSLSTSGSVVVPISAGGEYILFLGGTGDVTSTGFTATYTVTSSEVLTINPVIALYTNPSDPLVPYQLPACPPLYIPFTDFGLPDSSLRYPDVATGQAALSSSHASNCVGWSPSWGGLYSTTSFTATDGGTSLFLSCTADLTISNLYMNGGVYVLASSVLSISYTNNNTGLGFSDATFVNLYRLDGTFIEGKFAQLAASQSGTFLFNISQSGTIVITVQMNGAIVPSITGTITVTSDMTLIVNKLQALCANGDNCPTIIYCDPSP